MSKFKPGDKIVVRAPLLDSEATKNFWVRGADHMDNAKYFGPQIVHTVDDKSDPDVSAIYLDHDGERSKWFVHESLCRFAEVSDFCAPTASAGFHITPSQIADICAGPVGFSESTPDDATKLANLLRRMATLRKDTHTMRATVNANDEKLRSLKTEAEELFVKLARLP